MVLPRKSYKMEENNTIQSWLKWGRKAEQCQIGGAQRSNPLPPGNQCTRKLEEWKKQKQKFRYPRDVCWREIVRWAIRKISEHSVGISRDFSFWSGNSSIYSRLENTEMLLVLLKSSRSSFLEVIANSCNDARKCWYSKYPVLSHLFSHPKKLD